MTEIPSTATSTPSNPISSAWSRLTTQSGSRRALLLMAPLIVFELLIFVIPFAILLRISFAAPSSDGVYADGTWSLEAYQQVLATDLIWSIVGYSFFLGAVVTVLSVAIGLFYAYAIWRSSGLVKSLLLFSVVLPLLTTLVIRTYAFDPLLQPAGLLYSTVGVVIAQLYIVLPYAVLAIYSVMATTDWHVVEAARDLGASRPRSVLEVVVPQVMPGIIVATVVSFAWSVGAYAAPELLSNNITFAIYVEQLMLSDMSYPTAAALSAVMLGLMSLCIAAIFGVLNRFGGEFELA
ncbi:ABC transporter permease [Natronorubrum daqingense]|uniref:ABC transporter permease n=1 Tax=Natronorubrum daqingense TaxID=588898 RepID=A0A1N7E9K3_9EURY|nr:ABC transporter permease [Natronorubrum daqingense]APX96441.1 ABC transporter permease [Natronorubrum daqingense]SIR84823.1 spermidine/putrescine transport system permease protein [Natronorubrum daqingense]